MPYTIQLHKHRFSSWAAGKAANVNGCRFSVEQAKEIIEIAGLDQLLDDPNNLPLPNNIDAAHAEWRNSIIEGAATLGLEFTHGVAAKLINIYLKAGFVCGGFHDHDNVRALHPPIDSLLLDELSAHDIGGFRRAWNEARRIRWSKFNSQQYQTVIDNIRASLPNGAPWEIEQHWCGYQ